MALDLLERMLLPQQKPVILSEEWKTLSKQIVTKLISFDQGLLYNINL